MQHPTKIAILGVMLGVNALHGFDYNLKPKQVSSSVWCFFGKLEAPSKENGGFMSNSCYIKTKDSFVVIDSGPTYGFAKQSYVQMSQIAKLPVKIVINSHTHDDHWQGNSYYKEQFKSKLIGSRLQASEHKAGEMTRIAQMTTPEIYKGTKIVPLDETVSKETTLKVGGKSITITPVNHKAHTSDDLFITFNEEGVVFSGDLVMNGRISSNRDGSIIGELKAHDMINAKRWKTLVPGHGYITDAHAMDESHQYFTLLRQRVGKTVDDDIGAQKAMSSVKMDEFKKKALFEQLNKKNIFDGYSELEFAE